MPESVKRPAPEADLEAAGPPFKGTVSSDSRHIGDDRDRKML